MSKKVDKEELEEIEEELETSENEDNDNSPKNDSPEIKFVKQKIKEALEIEAKNNPLFLEKLNDKNKDIDKCWDYICSQAQKSKANCLHHSQIYRFAIDYYNDDIGKVKKVNVNGKLALENNDEEELYGECITDEDRKNAKEKALKRIEEDEYNKLKKEKEKEKEKIKQQNEKVVKSKKENNKESKFEKVSLFDM